MPSSTTPNGLSSKGSGIKAVEHTESDGDPIQKLAKIEKQYASTQKKYLDLLDDHKKLRDELKRLQEQDFRARKKDQSEPHDVVSRQFLDVFRMSTDWARDYFKINIKSFHLDEHELFKEHLEKVLWGDSGWAGKSRFNVSHLVQAVVAEVLARRILLLPFGACPPSFKHDFGQLYEGMLEENKPQAEKFRATALAAYWRRQEWTPFSSSVPEPTSQYRGIYYKEIAEEIDSIVGSIARKHFPERSDHDERFRRSLVFIEAAGNLAVTLGKQAAELKIVDKSWFDKSQRVFVCDDERMKGRFMEEDEDSEDGFRVDIVLRPGFLKYGNDEGEHFGKFAVWIPAELELRELGSSEAGGSSDTQESPQADNVGNGIPGAQQGQSPIPQHNAPLIESPHSKLVENGLDLRIPPEDTQSKSKPRSRSPTREHTPNEGESRATPTQAPAESQELVTKKLRKRQYIMDTGAKVMRWVRGLRDTIKPSK